ncbi:MAG TPA: potassium-transporting ATPase subunit KdpC [Polyangiaceae bacterium]|nr:potassium-transporting ATPase subunit KdpC [Polyangiaceae bacterium]
MISQIRSALAMLLSLSALTGLGYPLLVTGVARAAFPRQASGSLLIEAGRAKGSRLIGQPFDAPRYFWSRPSATTPAYNAAASSGSNLGPSNPALADAVKARVKALREADPGNDDPVPVDLVTASGSGLDPHLSPAAALYQVRRVARARALDEAKVRTLVQNHVEKRVLGVLGEPVVNVLELNLALDELD